MRKRNQGFTLIELLIVVVIVGILALAAVPIVVGNSQRARMAEGRTLLGSVRSTLRLTYAELGAPPATLDDVDMPLTSRTGNYYVVDEYDNSSTDPSITANPTDDDIGDPAIVNEFNWDSGAGTFNP